MHLLLDLFQSLPNVLDLPPLVIVLLQQSRSLRRTFRHCARRKHYDVRGTKKNISWCIQGCYAVRSGAMLCGDVLYCAVTCYAVSSSPSSVSDLAWRLLQCLGLEPALHVWTERSLLFAARRKCLHASYSQSQQKHNTNTSATVSGQHKCIAGSNLRIQSDRMKPHQFHRSNRICHLRACPCRSLSSGDLSDHKHVSCSCLWTRETQCRGT